MEKLVLWYFHLKSSLHNIHYTELKLETPPSLDISAFYGTFIYFDIPDFMACLQ